MSPGLTQLLTNLEQEYINNNYDRFIDVSKYNTDEEIKKLTNKRVKKYIINKLRKESNIEKKVVFTECKMLCFYDKPIRIEYETNKYLYISSMQMLKTILDEIVKINKYIIIKRDYYFRKSEYYLYFVN